MYAIVQTGGKQYRVSPGDILEVEKLPFEAGQTVQFGQVVAVVRDDGTIDAGPEVGAQVTGTVLGHGRGRKILVFKYHNKTNYRRRQGHRQAFTRVRIESFEGA